MKLLNDELIQRFKEVGSQENSEDPTVICKFFNPTGAGTWYATEYVEDERLFYGWVSIFRDHCDEFGSFSLDELQEYKGRFGLGIERDLFFKPTRLSEIKKRLYGSDTTD